MLGLRIWSVLLLGLVFTASGCSSRGPTVIPVTGVVRLEGSPVSGARVLFTPKGAGRPAEGVTDGEGRFELSTFGTRDGALPGEHAVTVFLIRTPTTGAAGKPEDSEEAMLASVTSVGGDQPPEWIVPQRYSDVASSGLSAKVDASTHDFTFELKKK